MTRWENLYQSAGSPIVALVVGRFKYSALLGPLAAKWERVIKLSDSLDPDFRHTRARRNLLITSIVVGVLTTGGTLAGNLINLVSGTPAFVLAVTGAVLAGAAAVVMLLVPVPASASESTADPPSSDSRSRSDRSAMSNHHPLSALRSIRLPLVFVLIVAAPWASTTEPDPEMRFLASASIALWVVLAIGVVRGFNLVPNGGGVRRRGAGLDAVLAYTVAAGIGIAQTEYTANPAAGLAVAGLALLLTTLIGGLLEEDIYAHKGTPFILVALGAAAGVWAFQESGFDARWVGLFGLGCAVCVVLPAAIRGAARDLGPGLVELALVLPFFGLAMAVDWRLLTPGVAIFLLSSVYTWRFRQPCPEFSEGFMNGSENIPEFMGGIAAFALVAILACGILTTIALHKTHDLFLWNLAYMLK